MTLIMTANSALNLEMKTKLTCWWSMADEWSDVGAELGRSLPEFNELCACVWHVQK